MDETDMQTMLRRLADTEAPPARVDISLAASRGRRVRRRRLAVAGSSTLAVAAAAGAIVTMVVPGSRTAAAPATGNSASSTPTPSRSAVVAPKQFNPMVPYASFGWLPPRYTTGGGVAPELASDTQSVSLSAGYGTTGATWFSLEVYAAGVCTQSGPASLPVLTCNTRNTGAGPLRTTSQAAAVNGRPAFWAKGADSSYLLWEYAPGAWSALTVPTKPQWPLTASRQAMLWRVASDIKYGDSTPVAFPYWVTSTPAGWTVSDVGFRVSPSGALLGSTLALGPSADPGALGFDIQPAPPGSSCKFIPGQSRYVTLDGGQAVLRTHTDPGTGYQSLCAGDVRGFLVDNSLDTTVPGSSAPVPGEAGLDGLLTISQRVHLLGTDTSGWTASPLR